MNRWAKRRIKLHKLVDELDALMVARRYKEAQTVVDDISAEIGEYQEVLDYEL